MAHMQYLPGDPRLVDQLVYELKSKGIFDQFRKDCIADVDTRPAYQNLRQRVENSVSTFLARQCWKPDLNKNQLREKLRKHILDGNYLEQGVERIVDQVVNPKVATIFVPKVEDLVYNYLGITRKKTLPETSNGAVDLLPTDLEAVSPGSVKSNDDNEPMEIDESSQPTKTNVNEEDYKEKVKIAVLELNDKVEEAETSGISELTIHDSDMSNDKDSIPLPAEEIRPEDIPPPENSPPKIEKIELEKIELPKEPDLATDIPLPDEIPKQENGTYFKTLNSDDESSSDSSLRRNMSPLTPIQNFNTENSCDAQQAFESQLTEDIKEEIKEPNSFRFTIDSKSDENVSDDHNNDKKETDLSYQFNQVKINNFDTPVFEDSSNSNNLHIDYESDANSKINIEAKIESDQNSEDIKKEKKNIDKKSSHKSSHRSRDSHKHSSSRDKKTDSKPSSSKDSSRHDKKLSKDDSKHKSNEKERSRDRSDKKEHKDSSRHRTSHKSSHRDSKSHRSSSSSHRHLNQSHDKKYVSSSQKDKEKSSDKPSSSRDKSKSSSHRSEKDRKSSSSSKSKSSEKDKDKKTKKDTDDHYGLSGRGNPNRRSTDRDSNDGSSSSKGSHHRPSSSKSSESKKDSKESTSKSDNTSGSGSTTPSDKEVTVNKAQVLQNKPVVRIETHLETPVASPPRLPFVPDITLKKPKIAANFEEAKKITKMRKFLEEEQRRMNQEAALLLEFQANVRPSLSQVYSSIPGPELEFACNTNTAAQYIIQNSAPHELEESYVEEKAYTNAELFEELNAGNETAVLTDNKDLKPNVDVKPIGNAETSVTELVEYPEAKVNKIEDFKLEKHKDNVVNEKLIEIDHKHKTVLENLPVSKKLKKEIVKEGKLSKVETTRGLITSENLYFFAEQDRFAAEFEKSKSEAFLKSFISKTTKSNKLYLINCDSYEENILKEASRSFGDYEIVNYHRNGHLQIPKTKSIVKNVNVSAEVSLPIDLEYDHSNDADSTKLQVFSPDKSECSFDLSSDYNAKLEEMVNNTSRKEIMQIILGDMIDGSPTKLPKIDYITESSIDSAYDCNLKRKINTVDTVENNNRPVLTTNKIRKVSSSELITSTTQDTEEPSDNKITNPSRSKYLGRAKRVGLPRPKRTELPNSPSSDKSIENYEENNQNPPKKSPNGKVKAPRHVVQRYETADLYKPKLHFLSRRNVT
ncbi:unnamed protein product [Leptosia nina]|uniref:BOD1/SHG1 domain-containing protein n=1 Tax=Leptosia nina TaxID=320188 RepID=A0AAV1IY62_9NEOP